LSKVYALSGLRVGYLCASPRLLEELRALTPPWAVGLLAQVAAVHALKDQPYYAGCYRQTHVLRERLARDLVQTGISETIPAVANFILFHLPPGGMTSAALVRGCRAYGLFLRDAAPMGSALGDKAVRIAVKDEATNAEIIRILRQVLTGDGPA
jgi:histidinol-phosphate/aromatic aminotransferase/cobyric acid decarboxylase-like protein